VTTATLKNHREAIDQWVRTFNAHNAVGVAALYAEDTRVSHPAYLQPLQGRKPVQDDTQACITALPDVSNELIRVIVEGDCAAVEMMMSGVHAGPLVLTTGMLPPTGRRLRLPVASFYRFHPEGQILEERRYYDTAQLLRQLTEAPPRR
jgi:steroid delta-isomerase-like uncharacterized protein